MSDTIRAFGERVHGRDIEVRCGDMDEFGQFPVALVVDGKVRWSARFSDRSEEDEAHG